MKTLSKLSIRHIVLIALVARILCLLIISLSDGALTEGYYRSNYVSDDLRYQDGAMYYSTSANSLIDQYAFTQSFRKVGDYIGYADSIQIWYWIVAILAYIFKSTFILKLINIIFGVLTVYYIYKLCLAVYPSDSLIAKIASFIYAVFPYPVFFSCFLYKDQLLTLVVVSIFYLMYKNDSIFNIQRLCVMALLLVLFSLLRSGLLPLLMVSLFIIYIDNNRQDSKVMTIQFKYIILGLIFIVGGWYFYVMNQEVIQMKLAAYVLDRAADSDLKGTTIQYFLINDFKDVWKLPLAYLFTILQPIYTGGKISSWASLASVLNMVAIPVVIGNCVYMFKRHKLRTSFWTASMILVCITIVVSMGVGRHFYYMMPFVYIYYAAYYVQFRKLSMLTNQISVFFICLYFLYFLKLQA